MNVITQASTIIAAIGLLCYLTFHRIASVAGYLLTPSKINKHALPRVTVSQHDYLSQLTGYKELYFKLQRLEDYPDVLPQARGMLLKLLAESLILARSRSTDRSILDIKCYSEEVMNNFLASENECVDILDQWEQYLDRRKAGQGPELFNSRSSAEQWLKQIAPAKYVDGAWLGHIHRVTTPFAQRKITKDAWQILSEELGDGDVHKNHVFLFQNLIHSIDDKFPDGECADFGHSRHGMDDMQVWKAAVAQLLISLFPNNFLPEILGFNLHYEQLTLETLKAARELPQFGISGYYFHIHVSIDNADSGHTAMALNVVANYMRQVEETKGINVAQDMWKRVQAGYVLSQVLGAEEAQVLDPLPHRMPLTQLEGRLLDIFKAKARASHRIHCASKVKIGQRSLVEWLSPKNWGSPEWQTDFLSELSRAKPWIKKGNSENSLLIRELEWKGRMFGAFTDAEVKVLAQWIDDPEPTKSDWQPSYWQLLGCKDYAKNTILGDSDLAVDHPVFLVKSESSEVRVLEVVPALASDEAEQDCQQGLPAHHLPEKLTVLGLRLSRFLPLWFSHTCLLENYISTPYHTSTRLGQDIVRLLRADYGYSIESKGVAGMDEYMKTCQTSIVDLGLQIMRHQHLPEPKCLKDILFEKEENISQVRFAYSMLEWAMYPKKNLGLLLGLARAFLELECWLSSEGSLLIKEEREALRQIVDRKRISLDRCFEEIQTEITHYRGFLRGYAIGRAEIEKVFQVTES